MRAQPTEAPCNPSLFAHAPVKWLWSRLPFRWEVLTFFIAAVLRCVALTVCIGAVGERGGAQCCWGVIVVASMVLGARVSHKPPCRRVLTV